jgi:hypothetical protein
LLLEATNDITEVGLGVLLSSSSLILGSLRTLEAANKFLAINADFLGLSCA